MRIAFLAGNFAPVRPGRSRTLIQPEMANKGGGPGSRALRFQAARRRIFIENITAHKSITGFAPRGSRCYTGSDE
jgi:hypothetical protein